MVDKLPCVDCICVPICRNKKLRTMFYDCKLMTRYWRSNVSLYTVETSACHALSIAQTMSHYLSRAFMPSCKNGAHGKRFGLFDVATEQRHDIHNTNTIIETYKMYYLNYEIDLLKIETISYPLKMILKKREPFDWKIEYDRVALERLSS